MVYPQSLVGAGIEDATINALQRRDSGEFDIIYIDIKHDGSLARSPHQRGTQTIRKYEAAQSKKERRASASMTHRTKQGH